MSSRLWRSILTRSGSFLQSTRRPFSEGLGQASTASVYALAMLTAVAIGLILMARRLVSQGLMGAW